MRSVNFICTFLSIRERARLRIEHSTLRIFWSKCIISNIASIAISVKFAIVLVRFFFNINNKILFTYAKYHTCLETEDMMHKEESFSLVKTNYRRMLFGEIINVETKKIFHQTK